MATLNPAVNSLRYSTYLHGSSGATLGYAIAVDSSANAAGARATARLPPGSARRSPEPAR